MPQKPKYDQRLLLEQVKQLYGQSYIASLGACTASIVTGIVLWPLVTHANLVIWVSAAIAITLVRHFFIIRYRRSRVSAKDVARWKKIFIRLIFISGAIWGSSAILIFPETSFSHQVFLSFILVGMVSGAIGTFSAVLPAFLAYAIPALLPLFITFFNAGTLIQQSMGGMIILYLALGSVSAYHLYNQTRTTLKLQFENIDLIHFLKQEKHRADSINKNLKDEVKERRRIEKILKRHRENLETMIDERTNALKKSNIDLKIEITEREKTKNALKDSEEKYRLLVENANDAIVIYQDGVSKFHNKRTEALLGYSARELYEKPFIELCHINDQDFLNNLLQNTPENKTEKSIIPGSSTRIINNDNKLLWVQVSAVPVTWENAPALLCFIKDITQQKHLEKQLLQAQKIEAIGTMAAGIAHDFNNILSGIQGNTSLALLNMETTQEYYNKFKDIESYIASGTELTRQLLDFASSKTSDQQPIDINQLINDTATMFCRTKKELRLHTYYNNINKVIKADSGQIRQAIINLLINAWQAMPKGGDIDIITEDITIKNLDNTPYKISSGTYIRISITDSGVGMDRSVVSKIFDPFFTTKKRGKGTGLGLSSVYGIIKSHDGHISVDRQPDRGSTFHIYFPVSHKQTTVIHPPDDSIATGTETILIIDDEPDILEIGKEMLEALGYQVHSAQNGNNAIEFYSTYKDRIHLVILDMVMPGMSGKQVYDRLVKINPNIKVLISSGYSQNGPAERILKKECNGFIQKPFKIQLLSQTIRKILKDPLN
ncbi:MAG: response regulator [Desulfobacteraceae bacterium]|nr:response regulator [Desulfobacteraceae bacterium]MBC2756021.1 response regulator [Desulfobacteraceae bacterium]